MNLNAVLLPTVESSRLAVVFDLMEFGLEGDGLGIGRELHDFHKLAGGLLTNFVLAPFDLRPLAQLAEQV